MTNNETNENQIIVNTKNNLELTKHIQKMPESLGLMQFESRLIANKEMYIGKIRCLNVSHGNLFGYPSIHRYKENEKKQGFIEKILSGKTFEHEGKKYNPSWDISLDNVIILQSDKDSITKIKFLEKMKSELVNKGYTVSNEFLETVYNPILPSLIKTFESVYKH